MSRAKRPRRVLPGTHHTRSGVGPTMTGSVASSSPTTKATRYVDILMVSAKVTARRPSSSVSSRSTAVLDTAARCGGTTRVTPKTALRAGSSQHGKPRRASVASNWVAAMVWATPAASLYVLR